LLAPTAAIQSHPYIEQQVAHGFSAFRIRSTLSGKILSWSSDPPPRDCKHRATAGAKNAAGFQTGSSSDVTGVRSQNGIWALHYSGLCVRTWVWGGLQVTSHFAAPLHFSPDPKSWQDHCGAGDQRERFLTALWSHAFRFHPCESPGALQMIRCTGMLYAERRRRVRPAIGNAMYVKRLRSIATRVACDSLVRIVTAIRQFHLMRGLPPGRS